MKLRFFISLVATILIVSTAGATEIYNKNGNTLNMFGNIVGGGYFSKDNQNKGDCSFVRYGVSGETYIDDDVIGFGMWEQEIRLQNIEGFSVKNNHQVLVGYAGIKFGKFGSIDYGRNYGILYDVVSWADIIPDFGGDLSCVDNFLSNRNSNVFTYRNRDLFGLIDGLDFALQYQGKNDINIMTGRTIKTANGEGYGVSASYSLNNGIAASLAYSNCKRISEQKHLDDVYGKDNAEAYSIGVKYDNYGMYAAAVYGETHNMTPFGNFDDSSNPDNFYGFIDKAKNFGVVAQYQFDFGFRPSISYIHSKADDMDNDYQSYLKRHLTVGLGYLFNKDVSITVDYRINLLNKNNFLTASQISTDNILAMGMSYVF